MVLHSDFQSVLHTVTGAHGGIPNVGAVRQRPDARRGRRARVARGAREVAHAVEVVALRREGSEATSRERWGHNGARVALVLPSHCVQLAN